MTTRANKKRNVESDTDGAKGIVKGLIQDGASLHKKKEVILANFGTAEGGVMSVFSAKYGGVGNKLHLVPKEWDEDYEPYYDDAKGHMVGLKIDEYELTAGELLLVAMSWNAYKKYDAWMCLAEGNKILCSYPRVRVTESEDEVGFKGKSLTVPAWRVTISNSSSVHYADPKTIMGFLKLDMVKATDFTRAALLVEDAVEKGGFKQIDPKEFSTTKKISAIARDTSVYSEKRGLATFLLGLHLRDGSMEDKISSFSASPSVPFAVAAGFKQILTAPIVNVSTKAVVSKVKLVDLSDETEVLMNKVVISQDYWNKFAQIETVEVYVNSGNLAMKKPGKKQTTAQKFDLETAANVKAVIKAICEVNNSEEQKKPAAKENEEVIEIDDDLFD